MIYQKRLTFLQNSVYPLSFDTSYKMYWPCMNKHWPFQMVMSKMICAEWELKEEKMLLIMKHTVCFNLAWQWRYLTDKTGFLFIGTHCTYSWKSQIFTSSGCLHIYNWIQLDVFCCWLLNNWKQHVLIVLPIMLKVWLSDFPERTLMYVT